jgi:hypothetical protein
LPLRHAAAEVADTNAKYAAFGFKGQLAITRGDTRAGLDMLENSMRDLGEADYRVWTISFNISRAQGRSNLGRLDEAVALTDDTIRLTVENGDLTYMPEILRQKAGILGSMKPVNLDAVEVCLAGSLEWSRRQGALSSELRAAIDFAALRAKHDRLTDARAVLGPVFDGFTEGFDMEI